MLLNCLIYTGLVDLSKRCENTPLSGSLLIAVLNKAHVCMNSAKKLHILTSIEIAETIFQGCYTIKIITVQHKVVFFYTFFAI